MLTQQQALWLQIITIIAVFLSPIVAVLITVWYQNRKEKRGTKINLFMTLVSTRDQVPVDYSYVLALNRIDVVFHKQKDILRLWHEYYDILGQKVVDDVARRRDHKRIELLSAMAKHLGYGDLQQISLEKYYQPHGHYQWNINAADIQTELLRVLKSTETLFVLGKYAETPLEKDFREGKVERKKLSDEGKNPPQV